MYCPNCKKQAKSKFRFYYEPAMRKFFCFNCGALLRGDKLMVFFDFMGIILGTITSILLLIFFNLLFEDLPDISVFIIFLAGLFSAAYLFGFIEEKFTKFILIMSPSDVEKEFGWIPKGCTLRQAKQTPYNQRHC